jgi:hypothetical protein
MGPPLQQERGLDDAEMRDYEDLRRVGSSSSFHGFGNEGLEQYLTQGGGGGSGTGSAPRTAEGSVRGDMDTPRSQ